MKERSKESAGLIEEMTAVPARLSRRALWRGPPQTTIPWIVGARRLTKTMFTRARPEMSIGE
jgi:hypothetical protein